MKRVVIAVHDFPPHGGGGVMRALKFVKYLPQFGWEPTVITAAPTAYDPITLDPRLEAEVAGVRIIRAWYPSRWAILKRLKRLEKPAPAAPTSTDPVEQRPSLIRRVKHFARHIVTPDFETPWVLPAYSILRRLHAAGEVDALITTNPPNSVHLVGYMAKRQLGLPWVADFRDQWVGNPVFAGPPWRERFERRLEAGVLSHADAVVAATSSIASHYEALGPKGPVVKITNGFDPDDFARLDLGFPEVFTVSYVGSMGPTYNTPNFLQAWGEFIRRRNLDPRSVACRIVGPVHHFDLGALVEAEDLLNQTVTMRPFVSHSEAVQEMARATALLLLVPAGPFGAHILTGKLFEYIAASKPIMALTPPGALSELLTAEKLGVGIHPHDVEGIVAHLDMLYEHHLRGTLSRLIEGRKIDGFNRRSLTGNLARVLDAAAGLETAESANPLAAHVPDGSVS